MFRTSKRLRLGFAVAN